MKKLAYYATIFFIIRTIISLPVSYASNLDNRLGEIYSTIIPGEIRRNFDQYIRQHQDCPECKPMVIDGDEFIDIYSKKFMVIDLKNNSFGGIWAVITMKEDRQQFFQLWLYDIEENVYALRSISKLISIRDNEFINEISAIKYNDFWL
ncbi:MAG: hypothetical protein KKF54_08525 [Candidatus Omnitrophica bacterium]|nr:hypothetical protein [Candidatus Omnitrophota bacterium]